MKLSRRKAKKALTAAVIDHLNKAAQSDAPVRSRSCEAEVLERAAEVIGDRPEALRWMGTPVRALGYATPVSMLHSPEGRQAVVNVHTQLEYGT